MKGTSIGTLVLTQPASYLTPKMRRMSATGLKPDLGASPQQKAPHGPGKVQPGLRRDRVHETGLLQVSFQISTKNLLERSSFRILKPFNFVVVSLDKYNQCHSMIGLVCFFFILQFQLICFIHTINMFQPSIFITGLFSHSVFWISVRWSHLSLGRIFGALTCLF